MFHPTLIRNMTLKERLHYGLVPDDIEEIVDEAVIREVKEAKEDLEDEIEYLEKKVKRLEEQLLEQKNKNIALISGSYPL